MGLQKAILINKFTLCVDKLKEKNTSFPFGFKES